MRRREDISALRAVHARLLSSTWWPMTLTIPSKRLRRSLFSTWDGWEHGFLANPLHRLAFRIDSPTTVQHDKDEYKCIHGGLLVASINVQSLRGAMQKNWRHSEQGLILSGRSGAYATDIPDDIFATRSKKNLACWQLSERKVHMAGLQEARPYSTGITMFGDFVVVSSAADKGGPHGCCCLFNLSIL